MEKYVCIHGHFYQPPRENPWLEAIEVQDSAYPYHDWNEKITAECYAPNSASRLQDEQGRITHIVGNYAKMSFNFGPTLLSWMREKVPETYQAILEADKRSIEWRSGHGSALSQVYNHIIMPLANSRDKHTQVIWGIRDFEYRFQRLPEGMWLAETAVDTATLEVLAEHGIKFTILSPHQAGKVRKTGSGRWKDLSEEGIDPSRAYLCKLPSGRRINLFFYDGPISKAVAFEKLLERGEDFANRILGSSSDERQWPQLLHIATDGESYGHHHKFGDMALAYAMHFIEWNNLARLTNYGEYLETNPPAHEVQIIENTSWSCAHGIERWRSDCGCNTGGLPGWNQKWRTPLREALDWLRDEIAPHYERKAKEYLNDPWAARDGYIDVILDRSDESIEAYLKKFAARELAPHEKSELLQLLEMQRHAMLMYTSCGWFFTELSGIETVQVIQYAARTIQLAEKLCGLQIESIFTEKLSLAKSNIPERKDGAEIYKKMVMPGEIDFKKVAIHYAISSLMEDYGETTRIFSYSVKKEDYRKIDKDGASIAIGKVVITSEITQESETISFCAQHLGKHHFNGGLQTYPGDDKYGEMKHTLFSAFEAKPESGVPDQVTECFGTNSYSLKDLFMDEKRKVLKLVTTEIAQNFEESDRAMYENNRSLMGFIQEAGIPVPKVFLDACGFTLNLNLVHVFDNEKIDPEKIRHLIDEINKWNVPFDATNIEFALRRRLERMMFEFQERPEDGALLAEIHTAIEVSRLIPLEMNLWLVQNIYFRMTENSYPEILSRAKAGDAEAAKWIESFKALGEVLNFNTASVPGED